LLTPHLPLTKKNKIALDIIAKSAIIKLPKERATTAESVTVNLLGFQEKKNWSKKIKNPSKGLDNMAEMLYTKSVIKER